MLSTAPSLLERLRQPNQQDAWGRFVQLYTPLLLDWGRRLGLCDADSADLVQEVLLLLLRKLPDFVYDPNKSLRAKYAGNHRDRGLAIWAPDSQRLYSFGGVISDARVRVWDLDGRELFPPLANLGALRALRLARTEVLTSSVNFAAFGVAQGPGRALKGLPWMETDFRISPDGRRLAAVSGWGQDVKVYDANTGVVSQVFSGPLLEEIEERMESP